MTLSLEPEGELVDFRIGSDAPAAPSRAQKMLFFFFFLQEPKGSEYKVKLPPSLRS